MTGSLDPLPSALRSSESAGLRNERVRHLVSAQDKLDFTDSYYLLTY